MSKRNPATAPPPLTAEILSHRHGFQRFVLDHADPWHREHLGRMFSRWRSWNGEHFDGRLEPPYLLLSEPSNPRRLGDCGALSGFGGRSQIRIRPSLVRGSHPHVRAGEEYAEGRRRFVDDVLLHEMIHQWQFEVIGDSEPAYHGHGPLFRDVANRIGAALGLPAVRDCKRRGTSKDLPSCSHWPHVVRPEGFYLGALRRGVHDDDGDHDLERVKRFAVRFLWRRAEDNDVLTLEAVERLLEAVAAGIGTLTGDPRTFNAPLAARLLLGGVDAGEPCEVAE